MLFYLLFNFKPSKKNSLQLCTQKLNLHLWKEFIFVLQRWSDLCMVEFILEVEILQPGYDRFHQSQKDVTAQYLKDELKSSNK